MKCSICWIVSNSLMQSFMFSHLTRRQDKKTTLWSCIHLAHLTKSFPKQILHYSIDVGMPYILFSHDHVLPAFMSSDLNMLSTFLLGMPQIDLICNPDSQICSILASIYIFSTTNEQLASLVAI